MNPDALERARPPVRALQAYDPGHDLPALRVRFGAVLAELGSNENPLGPSPRTLQAARAALDTCYRYPDPRGAALRRALAARHGVDVDGIVLGNGSHELLMLLAQCFAGPGQGVLYAQYGFAVFAIAAAAAGAPAVRVPALPRGHTQAPLGHDLPAMVAALREHGDVGLVYLANPNNPTGTRFARAELEAFLAEVPERVLVVVDEAYGEYLPDPVHDSALGLLSRHANLIVTRTFSKAYALAGLRVGYLAAHPQVAAVLERLRESFNVNGVALAAAEAALADTGYLRDGLDWNARERTWLAAALGERGFATLPSHTNFLLLDLGVDATALEHQLFERGAIVRPMGGYGLPHTLRVSIGRRDENERLLEALA